jgi:uncharacterized protein (DUF362 family)/NAD-dependent dihydropyrimidine dehydrogenase PreA subunit
MSTVLVRNATRNDYATIVREIFGLFDVDLSGKSVLIKPNILTPMPPESGAVTDPQLVKAILEACLEQTSNVAVGDNPGGLQGNARSTAEAAGFLDAAGEYYVNISETGEWVDLDSEIVQKVFVSKIIGQVDYIINVPKLKTHVLTGLTGCVKNMFGSIIGSSKSRLHIDTGHPKRFTQMLIDLYRHRPPDLNIMDGVLAMEGNGPSHGKLRHVGKVLAGTNGMEVDVVATCMIGWQPSEIKTFELGSKAGLGESELSKINVVGDFEVLEPFERPVTHALTREEAVEIFVAITSCRPQLNEELCTMCGRCVEEACPAGAISLDPYPVIDGTKCISCFCCVELCPEGAMSVPDTEKLWNMMFGRT